MKAWMKYSLMGIAVVGVTFWTYVSVVARQEMRPFFVQSRVRIDHEWIDEWLRIRELKRLEMGIEKAVINDEPEVAAKKMLQLSRSSLYYKLMEDLKVLEPAMDAETKALIKKVPAWAKS
jgi:hypothetical protein